MITVSAYDGERKCHCGNKAAVIVSCTVGSEWVVFVVQLCLRCMKELKHGLQRQG